MNIIIGGTSLIQEYMSTWSLIVQYGNSVKSSKGDNHESGN